MAFPIRRSRRVGSTRIRRGRIPLSRRYIRYNFVRPRRALPYVRGMRRALRP